MDATDGVRYFCKTELARAQIYFMCEYNTSRK